jgi:2-polyprenyl-6-methoxyphenol hydroxylase-like FAD-dependent oxidoreductase
MGAGLTKTKRIAIAGGGIGGFTAAIAIAHHCRHQFEIVLFEKANAISANGALLVWSNAIAALESLGLRAPIEKVAARLSLTEIRKSNGDLLSSLPVGDWSERFGGASTVVIRRKALLDVLRAALPASRCDLRMGAALRSFEEATNGVKLELEDGSVETADVLIGADGFHSVVRRQMLGEEEAREGSYDAWVGIAPRADRPADFRDGVATATLGRGPRFWSAALEDGSIFWYATVNRRGRSVRTLEQLRELLDGWHEPIDDLIRATPKEELIRTQVRDRLPIDAWGRGPVTLLGDAAHPSTPDLGQGACQAIESGLVLGRCVGEEDSLEEALRSYEEKRISRTAAISRLCWMTSANSTTESTLACSARDLAIRVGLESVAKSSLSWILRGSASSEKPAQASSVSSS